MPTIKAVRLTPVSFRLKQPFVTSQGRKTKTHNLQVTVVLSDGTQGVAEAFFSIAMAERTPPNMERVLKELVPEIREKDIRDYRTLIHTCWARQPFQSTAVAALESALMD